MSPKAQELRIAKFIYGDVRLSKGGLCDSYVHYIDDFGWHPIPSFVEDLNAMNEVEHRLSPTQLHRYMNYLGNIVAEDMKIKTSDKGKARLAITASASQRAKAFLLTIGYLKKNFKSKSSRNSVKC